MWRGWLGIVLMLVTGCGRFGFDEQPATESETDAAPPPPPTAIDAAPVDASRPPSDPSGTYVVAPAIVYQCALGLVNLNITAMTVDDAAGLEVQGSPCSQSGTYDPASGTLTATCTLPGTCDETYELTGTFVSEDTFEGDFIATFVGNCLNCLNQQFEVTLSP